MRPASLVSLSLALAGLAAQAGAQNFVYDDFDDTTGLELVGNSFPWQGVLRLTPSLNSNVGGAWYDTPVTVRGGFETTFEFQITSTAGGGADGMALVIHNDPRGTAALGSPGGSLAYGSDPAPGPGLVNSVAFEIDTWPNGFNVDPDPDDNHCSVHTNGQAENQPDETFSIGRSTFPFDASDGAVHSMRVVYLPGTLEVFVDGSTTALLSIAYDLELGGTWLNGNPVGGIDLMSGGMAYVGFTAATGGVAENHDVVSWEWGSGLVVNAYCFGDGSGTACPCGNPGGPQEGCGNSTGAGAMIAATGSSSVAADDLGLTGAGLLPFQPALLFAGENAVNNGDGVVFGDGLRCAGGTVKRLGVRNGDGAGDAAWGPGLANQGGWQPGDTRRFQIWYRDPAGSPCGSGFNLSHGLEIPFTL
ncbi:MAG: L-type lectin-domain containing protein [Planctomycetota bacterium]|jgi:hypothetical protein|nr:L-type lectin-domain containing protein [Planctomycetota bacterium]MDP6763192.1 L-type lectin-domain containing protein [Planctomycetota bacterium]MDP6990599.1 L-type lectin-domain containing protein [Planctomycetota bacterium]